MYKIFKIFIILISIIHFNLNASQEEFKSISNTSATLFEINNVVKLTHKEQNWLKNHPKIRFTGDPSWLPFETFDENGNYKGIVAEHLKIIEQNLGIKLTYIKPSSWSDAVKMTQNGSVDMISEVVAQNTVSKTMNYTKSYIQTPLVTITNKNSNITSISDLNKYKDKRIAYVKDYGYIKELKKLYPNIKFKEVDTVRDGLEQVATNQIDIMVLTLTIGSYNITHLGLSNLQIVGKLPITMKLGFGIKKEWKELIPIMNKAIDSILPKQQQNIMKKWVNLENKPSIYFTPDEKKWLARHPTIRLAYMNYWQINNSGENIHSDYIKLLSKYGNINISLVKYDSWKNGFEDAQKGINSYGILNLSWSKEREEKNYDYTKPYYFTPGYIIVKKDNDDIKSIEDLANKSIYVKEDSITSQIVKELKFNIQGIEKKSAKDMYIALSKNDSKASAILTYLENPEFLEKYNLKIANKFFSKAGEVHIGVSKKHKELYSILNKIYAIIPKDELSRIQNKDYQHNILQNVHLSFKEKEFIKNNPIIRVDNEKNWPPFNFNEFGQAKGYSIDLMKLVAQNTGLKIKFITGPTWNKFLEMMKENQLDVMLNIVKSEKRSKYMLFTDPFMNAQHGIAVNKDSTDIKSFDDIIKNNKSIAVERGFYYHEYMSKNYPQIKLNLMDNSSQTLAQVSYKNADATFGVLPVMQYLAGSNYITNLKFFGDSNAKLFKPLLLRFAVRDELPELQAILQKGLASITPKQKIKLAQKWFGVEKQEKPLVQLNDEERKWLKNHKNIKFTADPNYLPFEAFNKNGKYVGIVSEYLSIFEKMLHINFEKIPTTSWSESLSKAKNLEVDVLSNYTVDKDMEKFQITSKPYIKSPIVLITKNKVKKINSLDEFKNKKIAVIKGYGYLKDIFDAYPNLNYIEVKNADEGLMGVSAGKYDGILCSLSLGTFKITKLGLSHLKVLYQTNTIMELGLGIRKDWKIFINIINKVIDAIPSRQILEIQQKWVGNVGSILKKITLTNKEKKWLDKNKKLKYVYDVNWAPFEWKNALGKHTGMSYDILALIEQRSGIRFEQVNTKKWSDAVALVKSGKVKMYSGIGENKERKKYLNFSKNAIFKIPYVFVTKKNDKNDYLETFKVIKNKKVSVVENYTIHGILDDNYPNLPLDFVKNVEEGFDKVSKAETDIFIVNAGTAKYYINRMGYDNLKIATKIDFNLEFKIALRKEVAPEAMSIINKAIETISEKERSDIYFKWTQAQVSTKIDWNLVYKLSGGTLFIILLILYWNRKLKRTVNEKTKELRKLLDSFDENVIASRSDLKGNITYASDALCKISGYTKEELLGSPHSIVRHPDTPKEVFIDLWETIKNGKVWKGELKNKTKKGSYYWVEAIISPEFDDQGAISSYSAIRHEITSKKELEALSDSLEEKVLERTRELDNERTYTNSVINAQNNFVISTDGIRLRTGNKAFMKFYNVSNVEEFIQKYGNCICDTFDKDESDEFIQKIHHGQKWIEYVYTHKDKLNKVKITQNGKTYIYTMTTDKFMFNNEKLSVAVFTDITELEEIRKNIEMILSNIMLPVLITSQRSRVILYANEYASKQYEMTVDEIVGKNIDMVYTTVNQKDEILKEMNNKGYVENLEENYRTKSGNEFTALLSVKPINYNGEEAYIGMVVDITKQKEIEDEIRKIHKHTRDSIEYAALIQGALIPEQRLFNIFFKDSFVIWEPKDIVGGDIYLFDSFRDNNECLLMCIDCTGHGVPGAFVTMLVKAIERQIIAKIEHDKYNDIDISPAWVLAYFNKKMKQLLKQNDETSISNAGFDGGVIYYNKKKNILKFSGAETPLFYFDESNEFKIIKGSRQSVGYKKCDINYKYKEHIIPVKEGMKFYITTDGYLDQNGGEKDFPFGKKRFTTIIQENQTQYMDTQKDIFLKELQTYSNMVENNEQNDDITMIGFEIKDDEIETLLEYNGELTQGIISHNIDLLENKLTNMNMISKISTIVIELTQNMMNYSKSHEEESTQVVSSGSIEAIKDKYDNFFIKSRNIVSSEDKLNLEGKLKTIQSLDAVQIKKRYRELRKSGEESHDKGGGIGFYEIAKIARDINFEFKSINKNKYIFEIRVNIERREKERNN